MKKKTNNGKTFYYKRTLVPYLTKVLERATYDGKSINCKITLQDGIAIVTYDQKMVGNFTYRLYKKALERQKKDVIFEK